MTSGASDRQFESSSSDDDDDDEGWINDSQSFNRPVSEDAFSSMRREGSHHARDDVRFPLENPHRPLHSTDPQSSHHRALALARVQLLMTTT